MLVGSHGALRFHPPSRSTPPNPIQLLMSVLEGHFCDLCYPALNSLPVWLHSTALRLDGLVIDISMALASWGLFPPPVGFLFTEVRHRCFRAWGERLDGVRAREDTWSAASEQVSWRNLFCAWEAIFFSIRPSTNWMWPAHITEGNLLYLKYTFTLYFKLSLTYNLLYKSHININLI